MLTESSYLTGLYTYVGAALALLVCLGWWLGLHWRASWATLVVLVGAALLLTPAYPKEGGDHPGSSFGRRRVSVGPGGARGCRARHTPPGDDVGAGRGCVSPFEPDGFQAQGPRWYHAK